MLVRLKTLDEIQGFAIAGRIAADIIQMLVDMVKPGVTTGELDQAAKAACAERKVIPVFLGYRGFPAAICTSVNQELVHGIPSDRILLEGDLLKIDIGVGFDGFIGDVAKTVKVGLSFDKLMFDCHTALLRGIAIARPGREIGDIGEEISRTAKENGWQVILNYGGHGIDRGKLHADPFVENARSERRMHLRPGMVLAIEPMFVAGPNAQTEVAKDGWTVLSSGPSAHFEHTIVISELGEPKLLTKREEE
jgi:methionyl aminopeptidase